jgi:hypothetical protein
MAPPIAKVEAWGLVKSWRSGREIGVLKMTALRALADKKTETTLQRELRTRSIPGLLATLARSQTLGSASLMPTSSSYVFRRVEHSAPSTIAAHATGSGEKDYAASPLAKQL